jgi:hypothetical protein
VAPASFTDELPPISHNPSAPPKAKIPPASKKTTRERTTRKTVKAATKPTNKNRIFKVAKGNTSYNDKAVEARRAKDAHMSTNSKRIRTVRKNCSSEALLGAPSTILKVMNFTMRRP